MRSHSLKQILRRGTAMSLWFWAMGPVMLRAGLNEPEVILTPVTSIQNPGFELGSGPWGYWLATRVSTGVASGSHAARVDGPAGGIWQTLSGLSPDTLYRLAVQARLSEAGQSVTLYAKNYGGSQGTNTALHGSAFTEHILLFTTGPGATTAEIGIWKDTGSGYVIVDDFTLHQMTPVPPPPPAGSLAAWRRQHFSDAQLADPDISGNEASPGGDGQPNLLKYHLGLSPWQNLPPESALTPGVQNGAFFAEYRRSRQAPEVIGRIEASSNLQHWFPLETSSEVLEQNATEARVRATGPSDVVSPLFFRLSAHTGTDSRPIAEARTERLLADASLLHEAPPHGILVVSWATRARNGAAINSTRRAVNMWGHVYMAMDGDPEALSSLRVEMKDVRLFAKTNDGQWHLLHTAPNVAGADFREDFAANASQTPDLVYTLPGNTAVRLRPNWNFHLWSGGSNAGWADITGFESDGASTIVALASSYKARLIDADTLGAPDPDAVRRARIVAGVGGDCENKDGTFGWDWGIGRFRLLSGQWTPVTFSTASRESLLSDPPPLYPADDPHWSTPAPLPGWSLTNIGFVSNRSSVYWQDFNAAGYGQPVPGWTVTGGVDRDDQRITSFAPGANGTPTAIFDTRGGDTPIGMTLTGNTGVTFRPGRIYHLTFRLWKAATAYPYEGNFTYRIYAGDPGAGGTLLGSGHVDGAIDGYEAWRDVSWLLSLMSNSSSVTASPNLYVQFAAEAPTNTEGLAQVQLDDLHIREVLPPPPTDAAYENGVWTITGCGEGLGNTSDRLAFVSRYLSGDHVLQRRLGAMSTETPGATAGLMARGSDQADAPFAAVLRTGTGAVQMRWRASSGAEVQTLTASGETSAASHLRLTRTDNSFSAAFSNDGQNWTLIGTQHANLPTQAYLGGMMVSSASTDEATTVTFD